MPEPKLVDTSERAEQIFEVFHARPHRRRVQMSFSWPAKMQEVGQGKAVMYRSNKWKRNLRDYEDYKHRAEAWQTLYVAPGFLRDWWTPSKKVPVYGPMGKFEPPMPQHFTILAPLLGVQIKLFDETGKLPRGAQRLYEVTIPHGMLGAAEHPETEETILFVYNKSGIHMMFTGPELAIEKDGVAG